MDREDASSSIEGLDDEDIKNFIDEEEEEEVEDANSKSYLDSVELQNDCLMENKLKEYLQLCKSRKSKIDFGFSKDFFLKESAPKPDSGKSATDLLAMDAEELKLLITNLKNAIMGMRVKVANIIDLVSQSESDPKESISLINLRVEVLCEYWTYLSLLVVKKVKYT